MPRPNKAPSRTVRAILKIEFRKRKKRNPAYSLRAFAIFLGISSSFLSKILKGERPVGRSTLEKIANRLKWENEIVEELTLKDKKAPKKLTI